MKFPQVVFNWKNTANEWKTNVCDWAAEYSRHVRLAWWATDRREVESNVTEWLNNNKANSSDLHLENSTVSKLTYCQEKANLDSRILVMVWNKIGVRPWMYVIRACESMPVKGLERQSLVFPQISNKYNPTRTYFIYRINGKLLI